MLHCEPTTPPAWLKLDQKWSGKKTKFGRRRKITTLEMRAAGRSSVSIGNAPRRSTRAINGRLSVLRVRAREAQSKAAERNTP